MRGWEIYALAVNWGPDSPWVWLLSHSDQQAMSILGRTVVILRKGPGAWGWLAGSHPIAQGQKEENVQPDRKGLGGRGYAL